MIENNNMNNIQDNNEELPQNPQQYFDINVNNINNNNNELYQNPQSLSQAQANIINNLMIILKNQNNKKLTQFQLKINHILLY